MEYFLFIIIFALFVLYTIFKKGSSEEVIIFYVLILFVSFVIGMRGNSDEYTRIFDNVPLLYNFFSIDNKLLYEKGFVFGLICSTIRTLGLNSQVLLFGFGTVSILIHAVYYRKFTRYYSLAFLIYLSHEICFKEWNGIRMGLASAMVLPAIDMVLSQKRIKFFALVLLSTLIHYAGVLSIFIYFLKRKFNPIKMMTVLLISIGFLYTGFAKTTMLFLGDNGLLPSFVANYLRYNAYVYDVGLFHLKTFQQIIFCFFILLLIDSKKIRPSPYFNIIFNTYFLSTIFYISFNQMALFAFRFGSHFYVVEPLLIIYLVYSFRPKQFALVMLVCFSLLLSYENYVIRGKVSPYVFMVDQNHTENINL